LEDLNWFKLCTAKGLSDTHSTTLTTFLNQFENNLKARKEKAIIDDDDIRSLVTESLKFFDDVVVREEIYRLYLKRMKIQDEINKL